MLVTLRTETIAANKAGMDAQATADTNAANQTGHAADPNAHHIPTTPSGEAVTTSARLPAGNVVQRLGWSQTQDVTEAIFTRADNHPTDGAAVGTVAGLNPPVFPPALATDPDLYMFIWIATAQSNIADIRLSGGGGTLRGSFSNGAAFTYGGGVGTFYVSNQRLSPGLSAYQISAIVGGELIASQPWVTAQIAAIPTLTAAGASWHWFATFALFATQAAGSAVNGTYRTGPFGSYADADAVRVGITSNAIPQLVVYFEEVDMDGTDSDINREVVPTSSGFGENAGMLNVFEAFTVGGSPKKFALDISGATPTLTPDFAFTVAPGGQNAIHVRVGVWA